MSARSTHYPAGTGTPVGNGLQLRVPAEATAGSITVHEGVLAIDEGVPLHVHDAADQLLYVIEGRLEVTVGDSTFAALPGDLIAKPHGIPHGFSNAGTEPARVLEITAGDSFERLTLAASRLSDPTGFLALQAEHGVHLVNASPL